METILFKSKVYLYTLVLIFIIFLTNSIYSQIVANKDKGAWEEKDYFFIKQQYEKFLESKENAFKPANSWMNRWLWNNRLDVNRDGSFKYYEMDNAEFMDKVYESKRDRELSNSNWVPVGPINMPISYEPRSCYSMGRVNCIAFHPQNKNIFWIGTPGGGIWKTEDYGKSWFPQTDNLPTLAVSHICVDPNNPDVIYAATGDFDTGTLTAWNALGVIKSTDGGNSWTLTGLIKDQNFRNSLIRKVLVNPQHSDQIIAAGKRGIWKSLDAGNNWQYVCDSIVMDLEMNPYNPMTLYAAVGEVWGQGSSGVLKSTDFGETWIALETGMVPKGEISRIDIAISPADTNYLYLLAVKGKTNGLHSFYNSTDAGNTWQMKVYGDSSTNILGAWGGDANDRYGQGWYDLVLMPDPYDKKKVYVGGVNIWASENEGSDWEIVSFWVYCFGESTHADQHYSAFNPLDKCFYWCNDGGVYRTEAIIAGSKDWINEWVDKYTEDAKPGHPDFKFPTKWENLSDGLAITEFYRMSLCKNTIDVLAGGSQDNSCFYYNKGDWTNYIPNYDGMETMIDNDNPEIIYGVWQFGTLCKSYDAGKTLETRLNDTITNFHKERGNWVTPVAMDPVNSEVIYMGFRNLWRSNDGGYHWEKAFSLDTLPDKPANQNSLSIIKIHPVNSDYISIYKDAYTYYNDSLKTYVRLPGELWITKDRGANWYKSTVGLPLDSLNIVGIEYDYYNPNKMWAVVYSYYTNINTYVSYDGGMSWGDISKPMPSSILIRTIAHQPQSQRNILYVGTNRGVYYTDDSLAKWESYSDNLPNCIVNKLLIQQSTGELFAATYGRGIWKTNLLPSDVKEEKNIELAFEIYPNPILNDLFIRFHSTQTNFLNGADIKIVDILGRIVYQENNVILTMAGEKKITPNLKSGVYFFIIQANGRSWSGKINVSG